MEILPKVGLGSVRFGDRREDVIGILGVPGRERKHLNQRVSATLDYGRQSFGFTANDALVFIAVTEDHDLMLWGECPFRIATRSSVQVEEIAVWLRDLGHKFSSEVGCFGETITVPDEGLAFCFNSRNQSILEGMQIYAEEEAAEPGATDNPDDAQRI